MKTYTGGLILAPTTKRHVLKPVCCSNHLSIFRRRNNMLEFDCSIMNNDVTIFDKKLTQLYSVLPFRKNNNIEIIVAMINKSLFVLDS